MKEDYLFDESGDDLILPGVEVYCLRMSYVELPITGHMFSLVLRKVARRQGGGNVFERIGCIDVLMQLDPPPKDPIMDSVYGDKDESVVVIVSIFWCVLCKIILSSWFSSRHFGHCGASLRMLNPTLLAIDSPHLSSLTCRPHLTMKHLARCARLL